MTKDQIIVGQKYKHKDNNYTYLGIGKLALKPHYSDYQDNFSDKNLVVTGGCGSLGLVVHDPGDCVDGFWDGFEKID